MSVLFCDTDCDLWYTRVDELGLKIIPMPYIVDGEEIMYDLGRKQDVRAFYDKMRKGAACKTAGLNEGIYDQIFRPYFEKGEDILYIAFSSHMSGTFTYLENAINKLKAEFPNVKYRQFDTLNIAAGTGIQVLMGAKFFKECGGDVDKTYEYMEGVVNHIAVNFVVDDIGYLARGGRISPAKAKIGNFLQIKPVLGVHDGELDVEVKANGRVKAYKYMIDKFLERYKDKDNAPILIVHADNGEGAKEFGKKLTEAYPEAKSKLVYQIVGPVIGVHCGPGTIGFIYTCK